MGDKWDDSLFEDDEVFEESRQTSEHTKKFESPQPPAKTEGSIKLARAANPESSETVLHVRKQDMMDALRSSSVHCFGGTIFSVKNDHGRELFAFAVAGESERLKALRAERYGEIDEMEQDGIRFPRYVGVIPSDEYHVYLFRLPESVFPVTQVQPEEAETVLAGLVGLLVKYQANYTAKDYIPLRSISPQTVFVDGHNRVYVVPLACDDQDLPVEVPRDQAPSIKTDLYSVCYLFSEIASGAVNGKVENIAKPRYEIVMQGLSAFPAWRPDLHTFASALKQSYVPPKAAAPQRQQSRAKAEPQKTGSGLMERLSSFNVAELFKREPAPQRASTFHREGE
jgi:hypothetical protein